MIDWIWISLQNKNVETSIVYFIIPKVSVFSKSLPALLFFVFCMKDSFVFVEFTKTAELRREELFIELQSLSML